MAYADFTLKTVDSQLGLTMQPADLFPGIEPMPVPAWLRELLDKTVQLSLLSEKARSEFIVAPVLVATRELSDDAVTIFSGERLDVQPERGLVGECDFLLARTPPLPVLRAPVVTVVEAKKNDIELGLGQCMAQLVGSRVFNERTGQPSQPLFGCVTTGGEWQFLRLDGDVVAIDRRRYYFDDLETILAVFQAMIREAAPVANGPTATTPSAPGPTGAL